MTTWSDEYREVVTHYFWEPTRIRPKEGWKGKGHQAVQMWDYISGYEVATNHILNFYFSLVPFAVLNRHAGWVQDDDYTMLASTELRAASDKWGSLTQPDMYFTGKANDLAVELKVGHHTSVDQIAKYIGFQALHSPGRRWSLLFISPYVDEGDLVKGAPDLAATFAMADCPQVRKASTNAALLEGWSTAKESLTVKAITLSDLLYAIRQAEALEHNEIAKRVHSGAVAWLEALALRC